MIERLLTHSNIFEVVGVDNYNSNYMKMKSQFLTQKEYCIPVYIIRRKCWRRNNSKNWVLVSLYGGRHNRRLAILSAHKI